MGDIRELSPEEFEKLTKRNLVSISYSNLLEAECFKEKREGTVAYKDANGQDILGNDFKEKGVCMSNLTTHQECVGCQHNFVYRIGRLLMVTHEFIEAHTPEEVALVRNINRRGERLSIEHLAKGNFYKYMRGFGQNLEELGVLFNSDTIKADNDFFTSGSTDEKGDTTLMVILREPTIVFDAYRKRKVGTPKTYAFEAEIYNGFRKQILKLGQYSGKEAFVRISDVLTGVKIGLEAKLKEFST